MGGDSFDLLGSLAGVLRYFTLFSAALAALFALGELLVLQRTRENALLAGLFVCLAVVLSHAHLLYTFRMREYSLFFQWNLPFSYVAGPLLRAFFGDMLEPGSVRRRIWPHCVPAALVLLIMLPYYIQPEAARQARVAAFYAGTSQDLGLYLFLGGIAHFAVYIALSVRPLIPLLSVRTLREEPVARVSLVILVALALLSTVGIVSLLVRSMRHLGVSLVILAALPPAIYLLRQRFPQFFQELEVAVKKEKYRNTQLRGLDLEQVQTKLQRLISEEEIYCDEELTLHGLAERLGLTAHQLSEYFNARLGVSFAGFINGHRIRKAAEMLKMEPARTVLSIAYEVGFNSKSAFNAAFLKEMGVSPSEFRRGQPGAAVRPAL